MKFWLQFRALFRKEKLDADMSEEMRLHLERRVEENVADGMAPEDARHAALRKFGGVEQAKEIARDRRGFGWLEQTLQDLRYALRQFARAKGFTAVVVLTLALGIGATTAIFSAVNTVILNPIAGPDPERFVQIGQRVMYGKQAQFAGVSPPVLTTLLANRAAFEGLAWCDTTTFERRTDDFVAREEGAYVPADFFTLLKARPLLGRTFAPDEAVPLGTDMLPTRDAVAVLSHAWWQSVFGGDRQIVGRTVELSGRRFTVVGVMPAHFQFPNSRIQFWAATEPYIPGPTSLGVRAPWTQIVARLKPGMTLPQTATMLEAWAKRLMAELPADDRYGGGWRSDPRGLMLHVRPLSVTLQDGRGAEELRRTLWGLFAATGFVLLIVGANVANLTLARVERRQHELAIRAALGAGRGRLMRQLLTENLLLALLGGATGLLMAAWGIKALSAWSDLPRLRPVTVDGPVLAVGLAISTVTALVFGLAPMLQGSRVRVSAKLSDGGANATSGRRRSGYRGALVVVQVAVAVVLLTGAGLMMRSVVHLLKVNPGFDPENLLWVDVPLPARKYERGSDAQALALKNSLYAQLHERLAALPGVSIVGFLHAYGGSENIIVEGRTDKVLVRFAGCGLEESDPFRAMHVPLLAGRAFTRADAEQKEGVVINEAMALLCWPGENAVGKTFRRGATVQHVVGVVSDARTEGFTAAAAPTFYRPYHEGSGMRIIGGIPPRFILRTGQDPHGLIAAVRSVLKEVEPAMDMPRFAVARQVLFDSTRAQRMYRNYLGIFAGVGLLLSALGIYGVLAYAVARRTREIGIRVAIGAERRHVMTMVMGEGARLIAAGVVVGLVAAFWLTKFLQKQLFGVSPHDPLVLGLAVAVLAAVGLLACWLPARRAAKVDPMVALRTE